MKSKIAMLVVLAIVALVCLTPVSVMAAPATSTMPAGSAAGGLRYTVSVSKFENRAGYSGQWDLGDGKGRSGWQKPV